MNPIVIYHLSPDRDLTRFMKDHFPTCTEKHSDEDGLWILHCRLGFLTTSILLSHNRTTIMSTDEKLVVCAVQVDLRPACETPMVACHRALTLLDRAVSQQQGQSKIDLFVFPELAPIGYSEDTFAKYLPKTKELRDMFVKMDHAFAEKARELQAHICYGSIGWKEGVDGSLVLSIRQKVVDPTGQVIAMYDKIHLCDYGDCAETRFFTAGPNEPVSFAIDGFQFGIIVCADM